MRRATRNVVLLLVCSLLLSSCAPGKDTETRQRGELQETPAALEEDRIVIGFSIATDTFIIERWNKDIKIFTEAVRDLGAEVVMQLSAGGSQAQIEQIEYLMKKDIDVLVVLAHDTDMLAGVIKTVHDQDIPVIAYDRLIQGVPIEAYVSFDNREVGRLFGRALEDSVGEGRYLIVNGSLKDNNSYEVNIGLHEIIDPAIESGSIELVDEIWLQEWSFDEASNAVHEVLQQTTEIDAISAGNDQLANAAIGLLAERRMAGEVAVVGQDADLLSCQRVVEGLQLMTVYKPIEKLASRAAELAVSLAHGRLPKPDLLLQNGSGREIPSYIESPIAVYADNMQETVIKDGFHSYTDVYRNVMDK